MIQSYVLRDNANEHAGIWYDGSVAQILYPKANLTSQRTSDFLKSIGKRENVECFFDAHIQWGKEHVCMDPAVLIDSTGMPNNIHFPLTAVSNHNEKVSRKIRMTTVVQRDSGYPLLFRLDAGNINDMSTITHSINELPMHNIVTDFLLMDKSLKMRICVCAHCNSAVSDGRDTSPKLTPLRVHSEEVLYEHLVLSMIAATMNIRIMNTTKRYHDDRQKVFMSLANQKCLVYRTQVNT